jgi:hypothetical protein
MPQGQADGWGVWIDAQAPQRPTTIGLHEKAEPLGMAVGAAFVKAKHLPALVARLEPPLQAACQSEAGHAPANDCCVQDAHALEGADLAPTFATKRKI